MKQLFMKTRTQHIPTVMHVLSWMVFIGYMIEAGAMLTSYTASIGNPEGAKNRYMGFSLYSVWQYDFWQYTFAVSFVLTQLGLKAYTAYLVITVLRTIKMANPFTVEVSNLLERISYFILATWVIAMLSNTQINWLSKRLGGALEGKLISGEFILLAGVVFVISQIFKKGVEIQSENELTV